MAMLQKTEKGIPVSKTAVETLKKNGELENIDYTATEQMLQHEKRMDTMYPILEKASVYKSFYEEAAYYLYGENTIDEVADKIYTKFYE